MRVACSLRGGPSDGNVLDLALPQCMGTLFMDDPAWVRQEQNGGVSIVSGGRMSTSRWVMYRQHIYKKVGRVQDGRVTYQFDRTDEVHRCAQVVEKTGVRCRNAAEGESELCRTHLKKRKE